MIGSSPTRRAWFKQDDRLLGSARGLGKTLKDVSGKPSGERSRALDLVMAHRVLADLPAGREPFGLAARLEGELEAERAFVEGLKVEPDLGIVGRELGGALQLGSRSLVVRRQREQAAVVRAGHAVVGIGGDGRLEAADRTLDVAALPGLEGDGVERAGRLFG